MVLVNWRPESISTVKAEKKKSPGSIASSPKKLLSWRLVLVNQPQESTIAILAIDHPQVLIIFRGRCSSQRLAFQGLEKAGRMAKILQSQCRLGHYEKVTHLANSV